MLIAASRASERERSGAWDRGACAAAATTGTAARTVGELGSAKDWAVRASEGVGGDGGVPWAFVRRGGRAGYMSKTALPVLGRMGCRVVCPASCGVMTWLVMRW